MKCYNHPSEDAVAVCKLCGKGICQNCTVQISGFTYCKNDVEAGRVPMQYAQYPQAPQIPPPSQYGMTYGTYGAPPMPSKAKSLFNRGAVGMIICGVSAAIYGAMALASLGGGLEVSTSFLTFVFVLIFAFTVSVAGAGFRAIKIAYGRTIGTAGYALGQLSTVLLAVPILIMFFVGISAASTYSYSSYSSMVDIIYAMIYMLIAGLVIFGVTQIIWGVALIVSRQFTGNSGLSLAAGIMLIVSGSIAASYVLVSVGLILFLVSAILAAIVFVTAKLPQAQPPQTA